jgi:sec-independent protein translocase protein TatB
MFGIDFSEIFVIAIVALIVIGPERLPKVARTVGHLLGRVQRYASEVKADISREMQLDELKKLKAEMQESARSVEQSISREIQAVEQVASEASRSAESAIQEGTANVTQIAAEATTMVNVIPPPASDSAADAHLPANKV